jgi:hypothetical protein
VYAEESAEFTIANRTRESLIKKETVRTFIPLFVFFCGAQSFLPAAKRKLFTAEDCAD